MLAVGVSHTSARSRYALLLAVSPYSPTYQCFCTQLSAAYHGQLTPAQHTHTVPWPDPQQLAPVKPMPSP